MVGHLNAHGRLAGDGCFHTHICHRKVQGDIVCQRGDAADLHTRHGLQFVSGNRGPAGDIQHPGAHAEAFQRVHQLLGVGLQLFLCAGVALLLCFFKQLDGRVLVLVAVHRLGLLGGCGGGCLLGDSGLFHGCCHQRVDVFFLHRLGGDADPAVLVRRRAERHGVLGTHPGHGGLDRRSLRLRGHLRLHHRRCRLDDGRIKSGGRLFRLGGIFGKEICRSGDYRVCHDGRRRGLGCRAQRVLPEGAARPDDQRLNGFAAALGESGVVGAKVYVKGRAGMGNADPHRGDGRRGRLRLGRGCGCSFSFGSVCLHLLRYLMPPAQHAGHPVRHPQMQPGGLVLLVQRLVLGFVVFLIDRPLCLPDGGALGAAGSALLCKGSAAGVDTAGDGTQPDPDLGGGNIKNVQAAAQQKHDHDEVCRRATAQQKQYAAQYKAHCAAGEPCIDAVGVAGGKHLQRRQPLRLDIGKHDDRAADKDKPQHQLEDAGQQLLAPGVQNGQTAHGCTQHKAAAAEQPEQHIMEHPPYGIAPHKGQHDQQQAAEQGAKPCREPLLCLFTAGGSTPFR